MNQSISLHYAWLGLVSYGCVHVLHLVVWRRAKLKSDIRWLFTLLFFVPAAIYGNLLLKVGVLSPWLAPFLVHCVLAMNYIAIYPAFQASSPTIHILDYLWRHGGKVLESDLISRFGCTGAIHHRLDDLLRSGLVIHSRDDLRLSLPGKIIARIFIIYRSTLGLPMGAG